MLVRALTLAADNAVNKTVGNAVDNTAPGIGLVPIPGPEGGKPGAMEQMLISQTMSRAGPGWVHG